MTSVLTEKRKKVFVVYGRDKSVREAMFHFLRAIDLRPIEWSQAIVLTEKGTPYIGEILDAAFTAAQAVVVLLTGDDKARLKKKLLKKRDASFEGTLRPQPRPNVLFEAGMAFGAYPDRTILVQVGELRPFSDVFGRHVVRLRNSRASRQDLVNRLKAVGCDVNVSGTDWLKAGKF